MLIIGSILATQGWQIAHRCKAEHCCKILNTYTAVVGQNHLRKAH